MDNSEDTNLHYLGDWHYLEGETFKLFKAAQSGDEKTLKQLLDDGSVEANDIDDGELTPLHVAVEAGNCKIAELLIKYGADVNPQSNDPAPLRIAVRRGHCDIVELLLDNGAKIHDLRRPLLHFACYVGDEDVVELLLDRGADLDEKAPGGETALHAAAKGGYPEVVKLFLDEYNIDVKDFCEKSALFYAKRPDVIELLMDRGANINLRSWISYDRTILHNACHEGWAEAVWMLLEYNADINSEDNTGRNLFDSAMNGERLRGHPDSIKRNTALTLTRHIAKLLSQNLTVPSAYMDMVDNVEQYDTLKEDCLKEIEEMKTEMIAGSLSFYRLFLSRDLNQLAFIVSDDGIVKAVRSKYCKAKFPIYASSLKYQAKRGLWRKLLLDKVKRFFDAVADAEGNDGLPKLPFSCVDQILSYVSNNDLRCLIDVCDPFEFNTEISDIDI